MIRMIPLPIFWSVQKERHGHSKESNHTSIVLGKDGLGIYIFGTGEGTERGFIMINLLYRREFFVYDFFALS